MGRPCGAVRAGVLLLSLLLLVSCSGEPAGEPPAGDALIAEVPAYGVGYTGGEVPEERFIDLTVLSPTMLYAEVSHMNAAPREYDGATVRTTGTFAAIPARDGTQYVCRAADVTGCCFESLEFILKDPPAAWPEEGAQITVAGRVEAYVFNEYMTYCRLVDAEIVG